MPIKENTPDFVYRVGFGTIPAIHRIEKMKAVRLSFD
jgi:hypothetical protein